MSDVLNLFSEKPFSLSFENAKIAFCLSKQTIAEEWNCTDKKGYSTMDFVEFLEMTCRVAIFKFKDYETGLELPQKLEHIIEDLLQFVHLDRIEVSNAEAEEISESDEDY